MGIDVALETERGRQLAIVPDPTGILNRMLPSPDDTSFSCLRYVDPYGDTVFNRQQMFDVVAEIRRIVKNAADHEEIEFLGRIVELALRGQSEPHLYLKFIGD